VKKCTFALSGDSPGPGQEHGTVDEDGAGQEDVPACRKLPRVVQNVVSLVLLVAHDLA
jgi:hypothetical protein